MDETSPLAGLSEALSPSPQYSELGKTCECTADTMQANLKRRQIRLTAELQTVNDALDALDKNPDLVKFLDTIRKVARF